MTREGALWHVHFNSVDGVLNRFDFVGSCPTAVMIRVKEVVDKLHGRDLETVSESDVAVLAKFVVNSDENLEDIFEDEDLEDDLVEESEDTFPIFVCIRKF